MPEEKLERIAKVIARRGYCSRREAESIILTKNVLVNSMKITSLGSKVPIDADITIDDVKVADIKPTKIWAFNKPKGCITSRTDPQGRKTIFSFLPQDMQNLISVGRLDYNTEGLLLLCNNGEVKRKLELPKYKIIRIYKCKVYGKVPNDIKQKSQKGLTINGITYAPVACEITHSDTNQHWLKFILTEGKNREIRNICEYFGLKVSRLIRIQYGAIKLAKLKPGQAITLTEEETCNLLNL